MLLYLATEGVEHVNEAYPGGSGPDNPVPQNVAYYLGPYGYGIAGFLFLCLLLYVTMRLNADR